VCDAQRLLLMEQALLSHGRHHLCMCLPCKDGAGSTNHFLAGWPALARLLALFAQQQLMPECIGRSYMCCTPRTLSSVCCNGNAAHGFTCTHVVCVSPTTYASFLFHSSPLQAAKTYLEKHYETFPTASVEDMVQHGLRALAATLSEGELTKANCSVAIVGKNAPYVVLDDDDVEPYVQVKGGVWFYGGCEDTYNICCRELLQ
jgi:hypothetical protein